MKVFLIDFDLIVHRHQTTPSKDSNVTPNYPSARFLIRLDSLSQKPKTYSHRLVIFQTILFALDQSKEAQTLEVEAVYPSGGSKKGARGDRRLLIFKSNWGPKGQKNVFWDRRPPPPLSQGLDDRVPPLSEGMICHYIPYPDNLKYCCFRGLAVSGQTVNIKMYDC